MKRPVPLWRRYQRLFGPDPLADVDDELGFHLESKTEDLVAQGWQPDAARQEAVRQLGDMGRLRMVGHQFGQARQRREHRQAFRHEAVYDLRYALRLFSRDRGFAVVAVLVIGLGIAANIAVFSVVNTLLLKPLPFSTAHELTWLSSGQNMTAALRETAGLSGVTYTVDAFEEFQRHNQSFAEVTSYNPFFGSSEYLLTGHGDAEALDAVMVAGNFFQMLGVEPAHGRLFTADETVANGRPAVLLANGFWRTRFSADPGVVGRAVTLNGRTVTVVGVLPSSFDFGSVFSPGLRFDIFVPAVMDDIRAWGNTLAVVGRLKPGVSVRQAQAEVDLLFPRLEHEHPEWFGDYTSKVHGLQEFVSGELRRPLLVLWCAVGLVLLMVCVNLSSLLLARVTSRTQEFAMRTALGAGRLRLFRQLLAESAVFTGAGACVGALLALGLTRWLAGQETIALPLIDRIGIDWTTLLWTAGLVSMMTVLFAFVPAVRLTDESAKAALRGSGRGIAGNRRLEQLRAGLVVAEVTLACVLLIGAGLLLRSFIHVLDVDLGFTPARVAAIEIGYDDDGDGARRGVVLQQLVQAIEALPGVESAGVADMLPLGRNRSWGLRSKERTYDDIAPMATLVRIVTPGYLEAMGVRIQEGRTFAWSDARGTEPVAIVNEAAVRRHWPEGSPIDRLAQTTGNDGWQDTRIIGVVADVRARSVETSAEPEMYLPAWQAGPSGAVLVIRSGLPVTALAPSVLTMLRASNPNQPSAPLRPVQEMVDRSISPRRFFVLLVGSLAVLGLALAALGIFGVISYAVKQRTREIGVRMAVGASATQVRRQVLTQSLRLAGLGLVLGALASYAVGRVMASLLFETTPTDPLTYLAVAGLVVTIAAVAGYLPARAASRVEPMSALRQ